MQIVLEALRCSKDGEIVEAADLNLLPMFDHQTCPRQTSGSLVPPWQLCSCWRHISRARVFCCLRQHEDGT